MAIEEVWKDQVGRAKKNNSWGEQVNPFEVLKKDDTAINIPLEGIINILSVNFISPSTFNIWDSSIK